MGGVPTTAMNIVCFPRGELDTGVLADILRGGGDKITEAGAVVVGGHTVDDPEIKYGMAVTGVIDPRRIVRNVGARPGDAIVLTKALGTGILTTALKRGTLADETYDALVGSMTTLNRRAAEVMAGFEVHAATDVTGFGLLGHGYEMAHGSDVTLRLEAKHLPLLPEAEAMAAAGHVPGGGKRNRTWLADKVALAEGIPPARAEVCFDPQTSGGLLIAVAGEQGDALVEALHAAGIPVARRIGEARARGAAWIELV